MIPTRKVVTVLASGGIDSSALIGFYLERGFDVEALHFQYGQLNAENELNSVKKISEYYNVRLKVNYFGMRIRRLNYEYKYRNLMFLVAAAASSEDDFARLAIGVHAGTEYYDCSKNFISQTQNLFNSFTPDTLIVDTPFIDFTKDQIFEYCKQIRLPVHLTHSCESSERNPCGICPSCKDRRLLD